MSSLEQESASKGQDCLHFLGWIVYEAAKKMPSTIRIALEARVRAYR